MKKDDLRNDPVREKMLNALSFLRKNILISTSVSIAVVAGVVFILSNLEDKNQSDYSACFSVSENQDLDKYCEKKIIKEAIADISADKSSNQYLLSFLSSLSNASESDMLKSIKELDFSNIESGFLKSMLYKIHGDLLIDSSSFSEGIEKYQKALDVSDDSGTYSALINYKIASAYMIEDKYAESKKYLDIAMTCKVSEQATNLTRKMGILESRLGQALKQTSN